MAKRKSTRDAKNEKTRPNGGTRQSSKKRTVVLRRLLEQEPDQFEGGRSAAGDAEDIKKTSPPFTKTTRLQPKAQRSRKQRRTEKRLTRRRNRSSA